MEKNGDSVIIPSEMCFAIDEDLKNEEQSMTTFSKMIFPDITENIMDSNWLTGRFILAPTNVQVSSINTILQKMMSGEQINLASADALSDPKNCSTCSVEYINTLNPSGFPEHNLCLKQGVPLMLLRNLNSKDGLNNGTRLIFNKVLQNRLLVCTIVNEGEKRIVFIPRILFRPKEGMYPFDWSRRQFPVRIAFASTINKSMGQTMKVVGVWLSNPVFGHGQLYVALSRVGLPENLTLAIRPSLEEQIYSTKNVVYDEVLLQDEKSRQNC